MGMSGGVREVPRERAQELRGREGPTQVGELKWRKQLGEEPLHQSGLPLAAWDRNLSAEVQQIGLCTFCVTSSVEGGQRRC